MRRIKREQSRIEFFKSTTASRTAHLCADDRDSILRIDESRGAATDLERALAQVTRLGDTFFVDHADNDIDAVFLETLKLSELGDWNELPIDKECVESVALGPTRNVRVKSLARFDQGRQHLERTAPRRRFHLFHDCGERLFLHRQVTVRTKLRAGFGEEQSEEMIYLCYCRHG